MSSRSCATAVPMGCIEMPIGFTATDAEFLGEADANGTNHPRYAESRQPPGRIYDALDAIRCKFPGLHDHATSSWGQNAPKSPFLSALIIHYSQLLSFAHLFFSLTILVGGVPIFFPTFRRHVFLELFGLEDLPSFEGRLDAQYPP